MGTRERGAPAKARGRGRAGAAKAGQQRQQRAFVGGGGGGVTFNKSGSGRRSASGRGGSGGVAAEAVPRGGDYASPAPTSILTCAGYRLSCPPLPASAPTRGGNTTRSSGGQRAFPLGPKAVAAREKGAAARCREAIAFAAKKERKSSS